MATHLHPEAPSAEPETGLRQRRGAGGPQECAPAPGLPLRKGSGTLAPPGEESGCSASLRREGPQCPQGEAACLLKGQTPGPPEAPRGYPSAQGLAGKPEGDTIQLFISQTRNWPAMFVQMPCSQCHWPTVSRGNVYTNLTTVLA